MSTAEAYFHETWLGAVFQPRIKALKEPEQDGRHVGLSLSAAGAQTVFCVTGG